MRNPGILIASISIASLVLVSVLCGIYVPYHEEPAEDEGPEDFVPILRFAVASDVHIDDSGSVLEEERLAKLFEYAYGYADGHETYDSLDGVFFAGDFTNRGTPTSMRKFFDIVEDSVRNDTVVRPILGNHEFYYNGPATVDDFLTVSGYDSPDAHLELNGYHFILLSAGKGNHGDGYDEAARTWLEKELEKAYSDDRTHSRPIFVFTHHAVKGTVYGSELWYTNDLDGILEEYEQVVHFSGHSHFPINDPRSIWQGKFTALNTGTLSYAEMDLAGIRDGYVWPADHEGGYDLDGRRMTETAQFYIVEVDSKGSILIHGIDIISGESIMDPLYIPSVSDNRDFTYTDDRRKTADTPEFSDDDAVIVESVNNGEVKLRFTQADCDDTVQHYVAELYENGTLVSKEYCLSGMFFNPMPETLVVSFDGIEGSKEYSVSIFAVGPWEKRSEPISVTFTA